MIINREELEKSPVRMLRKSEGISMERLAVMAGLSLSTIRAAERGWASDESLRKIADALGVDHKTLMLQESEQ